VTLALIVAMTKERVIGRAGGLPWRLPEDLKRFKALTVGHTLIMGRVTYESIGRPLPGRKTVVVSRQAVTFPGVDVVPTLDEALRRAEGDALPFIAGGAQLYALALPRVQRAYVTWVDEVVEGDTHFPEEDWSRWREVQRTPAAGCTFVDYER